MNQRAIGYIRVSTTRQAEEGVSMDAQTARIRAWCDANAYGLVETFTDAGISGKRTANRPGLRRALDAACKRGAALVVYSLSRLARSTRDAIEIAERLDKAGADLVSLTEKIDTTTAAGKMVFRMLAVLADIRAMRAAGRSYRAIADELPRRGVPAKKGRGRWSHMAVVGIVKRNLERR